MSRYAYLAAGLVALVLLAGSHWRAYVAGGDSVRVEWMEEKQAAEAQAENNRLLRQVRINDISRKHVEKAAKNRHIAQSNQLKVDQYAPTDFPPLPGSFRVWHDAAAAGQEVDGSGRTDAPSVSLKAVAGTVADNYADSNYDKQRLEALQAIVRASGCFDVEE